MNNAKLLFTAVTIIYTAAVKFKRGSQPYKTKLKKGGLTPSFLY